MSHPRDSWHKPRFGVAAAAPAGPPVRPETLAGTGRWQRELPRRHEPGSGERGMGIENLTPTMRRILSSSVLVSLLALTSCHGHRHGRSIVVTSDPRLASVEVEVYDPASGYVWEDVSVRIVEASHEWSGVTITNPDPQAWFLTDEYGVVYFDPTQLALARIGFVEDTAGRALIEPEYDRDEATVVVELSAPGFPIVLADVYIDWTYPDAFVSLAYSPLPNPTAPAELESGLEGRPSVRPSLNSRGAASLGAAE